MTTITSRALPPPNNWQEFEALTFDLFKRLWKTDDAHMHGRSGQQQHGVDVYGTDRVHEKWVGVQCKGKNGDYHAEVTTSELQQEVEKAKKFTPALNRFVLVTTAPNDQKIQKEARRLNLENLKSGLFEVDVMGWEELKHLIQDHPDVLETYYEGLAPGLSQKLVDALEDTRDHITSELERRLPTTKGDVRASFAAAPTKADSHDRLGQRITDIAGMLNRNPQHVLDLLSDLWLAEGPSASDRNRYRIKANMASAYWMLGRRSEAGDHFRNAGEEIPEEGDGLAVLATAKMIEGDYAAAADLSRQALESNPDSERAAGILIETAPRDIPWEDLQGDLPEKFRQDPELLIALAERASGQGREKDANHLMKSAIRRAPDNWLVLARAALIKFGKVADKDEVRFLRLLRKADRMIVEEASDLFNQSWEVIKTSGWPTQGDWVAANRASTLLLLSNESAADETLRDAVSMCGHTPALLHVKAMRHMDKGEWSEALSDLSKIPEENWDDNIRLMLIQAEIRGGDPRKGLRTARVLYDGSEDRDLRIAAATYRIIAAAAISDESVREEATSALADYPESTILIATYLGIRPDAPEKNDLKLHLIENLPQDADPFTKDRVAHALYGIGEFSAAATLFLSLCDPETDDAHLRLALRSLGHSRRLKDARKLYHRLSCSVLANAEIRRLGTWIFDESGQVDRAREEFDAYLRLAEPDLDDRLTWLSLCLRIPDLEAATAYLQDVDSGVEGAPQSRMQLAHYMDRVIDDPFKTLEIGYRALRDGYHDARMHAAFIIGLFFMGRAGRNADLTRDVVGADTAVVLTADGREDLVRVIETAPNPMSRFNEIAIDDPFAQRLIGKRVGDQIEMESLTGGYTLTVKEVVSKYVHAQARALKDCDQMFPENKFLGGLKIDDENLLGSIQPMLDGLRERREMVKRLEELYQKGTVPLSILAQFGGGTVFDLWDHARHHPDLNVLVAEGSHGERNKAARAASGSSGRAIVDPATLYGAVGLGLSEVVLSALPGLMITRSSVDMLQQALAEREVSLGDPENSGVMVALEEGYAMIERSQEQTDALVSQLSQTIDLARRLEIVMPEQGVALSPEVEELFSEVGPAFIDTMIVAKEHDVPVLTDDLALRRMIWAEGLQSTWTQVAFQEARRANRLDPNAYIDAILAFLEASYAFTSVDTAAVLHEWRSSNEEDNPRLSRLLEQIAAPNNEKGSVAGLLGGLFMAACGVEDQEDARLRLVSRVYSVFLSRQTDEQAKGIMIDALSRAVEMNQRDGRREHLPGRLKSSTYLSSPEFLTPESDRVRERQILDTVGRCIQKTIGSHDIPKKQVATLSSG